MPPRQQQNFQLPTRSAPTNIPPQEPSSCCQQPPTIEPQLKPASQVVPRLMTGRFHVDQQIQHILQNCAPLINNTPPHLLGTNQLESQGSGSTSFEQHNRRTSSTSVNPDDQTERNIKIFPGLLKCIFCLSLLQLNLPDQILPHRSDKIKNYKKNKLLCYIVKL